MFSVSKYVKNAGPPKFKGTTVSLSFVKTNSCSKSKYLSPYATSGAGPAGPLGPTSPWSPFSPLGPISPVAPFGILKFKITSLLVPVFVTSAKEVGSTVSVWPTVIVVGSFSPLGPVGPISPLSPLGPWRPISPFGPISPCGPIGPGSPCNPVGPNT